jgi:uncharacterized protein YciI
MHHLSLIALGTLACAGLAAGDSHPAKEHAMHPIETYTVTYTVGPQWKPNQPMDKQDLAGHLAFVKTQFQRHAILASGRLASGKGFYVFGVADPKAIASLIAADPGIDAGVLVVDAVAPWTLLFEQLGDATHKPTFVLDYHPGPRWTRGKPLAEQDLAKHLDYVKSAFASRALVAGGPVDAHHGRYLLSLADRAGAEAWVKADPAVAAETVHVEITPWEVFDRQSPLR